jgi:proteasome lid subunit RPN8/RPN11
MSSGEHPGPRSAELPVIIRAALVAHARAEYPNEACGLIVGDECAAAGGRAVRFEPTRNRAASPYCYLARDAAQSPATRATASAMTRSSRATMRRTAGVRPDGVRTRSA